MSDLIFSLQESEESRKIIIDFLLTIQEYMEEKFTVDSKLYIIYYIEPSGDGRQTNTFNAMDCDFNFLKGFALAISVIKQWPITE